MGFKIEIWYAEHATEGNKFYKVAKITNGRRDGFAIAQYGPTQTHVGMEHFAVATVTCDLAISASPGVIKKESKRKSGYTQNTDHAVIALDDKDGLIQWIRTNIGPANRPKAVGLVQVMVDMKPPPVRNPLPIPELMPELPSRLSEHEDYGSW